MRFRKFLTYHPYLTYSDPLNTCFVKPDGAQKEHDTSDRERLFHLGREVYKRLGECQSQAEFDQGISGYYEMIDTFRERFAEWDNERKIKLVSELDGKNVSVEWDDEQVLNAAWQFFSKFENTTDADIKRIYVELFLIHALKEIDNANVALDLGESDAVYAAIEAANALANAMIVELGNDKLQEARRDMSLRGAMAKIAKDPKQREKAFIFECWKEWQKNPDSYGGKAAFARDMLTKCEELKSQKKIEDWCRGWEKTNPAG